MLLLASHLIPMRTPPLYQGAVRLEKNRIVALGLQKDLPARSGETVIDLGSCLLTPGWINAHCHLDYTNLKGKIPPPKDFVSWLHQIIAQKNQLKTQDYHHSIQAGYAQLLETGTTTVGNWEAHPDVFPYLDTPPLRVWWFLELLDARHPLDTATLFQQTEQFFSQKKNWKGGWGLAPHAPYTASLHLYQQALQWCESRQLPFTTHLAESQEEQAMFCQAKGPLFHWISAQSRNTFDCGKGSALSYLQHHQALPYSFLAVHLNTLEKNDWDILTSSPISVAHCPQSHTYFHHPTFPLEELHHKGINLCLGTDSLASNHSLDLRSEIRHAQKKHPNLSPYHWLKMVTLNPAQALGQQGCLGEISPGALADLVAFPCSTSSPPYDALIHSSCPPCFLMVDGQIKKQPSS